MTPGDPTAACIDRMDKSTAAKWARLVCDAIMAGRVSLAFGDEAVAMLEADGFFELASGVRLAVHTRAALQRSRGFASRSWVPRLMQEVLP